MIQNEPPKELFAPDGAENVVRLEIRLCLDAAGNVWSLHLIPPEDERRLLTWPGGGTRQVGHALLTEALRRETFNTALALMSAERPGFVDEWRVVDDAGKKALEDEIALLAHGVVSTTARKMAPDTAKEILTMLSGQARKTPVTTSEDEPQV